MSLKVKNYWESLYYSNNGKEISNPTGNIKRVRITWKDGTITEHDTWWETVSVPYDDMGHTYKGIQNRMFVEVSIHGTVIAFPLYKYLNDLVVDIIR